MTDPADDRRAAADTAERIVRRRRRADDPDQARLDGDGPWDVLAHIARHHQVDVDALRREIPDAFALVDFLGRELERLELGVWRAAAQAGLSYAQLAELRGMNHRQAAEQRKRRLEASAAGEAKSTTAARALRRDQAARRRSASAVDAKSHQVRAFAERLIELAALVPAAYAEDLDDIAAALKWWRQDRPTPPELRDDLRLLAAMLRTETGLDTQLGAVLAHGAQLVE